MVERASIADGPRRRREQDGPADHPGEAGVHHAVPARAHRARPRPAAAGRHARRPQARADGGVLELGPPRLRRRRRPRRDQLRAARRPADRRGRRRRHRLRAGRRGRSGDGDELAEGGLGIAIIRSIADEVEIGDGARRPRLAAPLREAPLTAARRRPAGAVAAEADRRLQPRSARLRARRGGERGRAARRRRPRDGAAPLVAHHDVTWIASALTDEDRAVAARGCGRGDGARRLALPAAARRPRARGLRPLLQRRRESRALVRPARALGTASTTRRATSLPAWEDGYVAVNGAFADAVLEELEREPDAAVFFHDYHLYVAPRARAGARARTRRWRTSSTSPGSTPRPGRCCPPPIVRAIHEGLLANDVVGFHTERWRRAFLASLRARSGLDPGGDARRPRIRSRSIRPSSRRSPERRRARARAAS